MTRGSIALFALALTTSAAHAQPSSAGQKADTAYEAGRAHYDLQEWDQAIARFKEAYKLRADARSLFNIAQSYRLKGECASAAGFYKTFKRNFPNERNVDKFIADMEACAKSGVKPVADPVKPDPVKPDPVNPDPVAVTPDPVSPDPVALDPVSPDPTLPVRTSSPGRGQRIAGLSMVGVGAVATSVGVVFGIKARGAAKDAEAIGPGGVWDPQIQEDGERFQRNARIALIGGGALLVGGTVLYMLGKRSADETPSVSLTPTQDGAAVVWSGGF